MENKNKSEETFGERSEVYYCVIVAEDRERERKSRKMKNKKKKKEKKSSRMNSVLRVLKGARGLGNGLAETAGKKFAEKCERNS